MKQKYLPLENYTGCLSGGSIGDALDAPVEFRNMLNFRTEIGSLTIDFEWDEKYPLN